MNLLRKLSFSLAFVLAALSLRAQAVIDLSAYIDDETAAQLGDNNAAALKNKISKIITRNGMADAAGLFVVTPTLTITDDGAVDTGMTTLHVLRADLTLSVKNLFEDTVFGSQTISLQANGKSMEACMRSLINKVNVNDARFAKLIGDVQQGIADYYTRQMPKILAKVNSLVAREEYEDAMAALAVIPESVDEYEAVEELKVQVYDLGQNNKVLCQYDLESAHGVVWNESTQRLYAIGGKSLKIYKLKNWESDTPELEEERTVETPKNSVHDLTAVNSHSLCIAGKSAYVYNTASGTFSELTHFSACTALKSVNYNEDTGEAWYTDATVPEGDQDWTTQTLRHTSNVKNGEADLLIRIPDLSVYKVRVLRW